MEAIRPQCLPKLQCYPLTPPNEFDLRLSDLFATTSPYQDEWRYSRATSMSTSLPQKSEAWFSFCYCWTLDPVWEFHSELSIRVKGTPFAIHISVRLDPLAPVCGTPRSCGVELINIGRLRAVSWGHNIATILTDWFQKVIVKLCSSISSILISGCSSK